MNVCFPFTIVITARKLSAFKDQGYSFAILTHDFIKFNITHLPGRFIHDHFPFKGLSASVYHIQVRPQALLTDSRKILFTRRQKLPPLF